MSHEFTIQAHPEILRDLQVNVLYFDDQAFPFLTYYDRGHVASYRGRASGYVLYINYHDTCSLERTAIETLSIFHIPTRSALSLSGRGCVLCQCRLSGQPRGQPMRYDASTQFVTWAEAHKRYSASDFHPPAWGRPSA